MYNFKMQLLRTTTCEYLLGTNSIKARANAITISAYFLYFPNCQFEFHKLKIKLNSRSIPQNQKELLTEKVRNEWPVIAKNFIKELDVSMNSQSQEDAQFDGDLLPTGLRTLNASNGIEEELIKYRAFLGYQNHKFEYFF